MCVFCTCYTCAGVYEIGKNLGLDCVFQFRHTHQLQANWQLWIFLLKTLIFYLSSIYTRYSSFYIEGFIQPGKICFHVI